jgi:hypothetical protein
MNPLLRMDCLDGVLILDDLGAGLIALFGQER